MRWSIGEMCCTDTDLALVGAAAASGNLQKLEGNIKEDQELASLRIGIEFGMGAFNLIVSLIPGQYHKTLELLGMPGDRARAIILLHRVSTTHHARAPLAALLLLHCKSHLFSQKIIVLFKSLSKYIFPSKRCI
jgi:hypothetical protein